MKWFVRSRNIAGNINYVKDLTEQALSKISPEYWNKCYGHMMKEVRHYMEHDGLIDKPVVQKPPDPDDQDQHEVKRIFLSFRFYVKSVW